MIFIVMHCLGWCHTRTPHTPIGKPMETLFLKPVKGKQTCKYRCYRRMWRDAILAEEQMWAAVEASLKQLEIYIALLRRDSSRFRFDAWIYLGSGKFKDDLKIHQ